MDQRIKNILYREASKIDLIGASKHCAAVLHKGKIVSLGTSQLKTHPMMRLFQTTVHKIYLHAEIDAIQKSLRLYDEKFLQECDMYVLRITRGGNIGNSKPCPGCQRAIDKYGFREVKFTCNELNQQLEAA